MWSFKSLNQILPPSGIIALGLFLTSLSSPTMASDSVAIVSGTTKFDNTGGSLEFNYSPYSSSVVINNTTHRFSGYAWSTDFGWIDFGSADNKSDPVKVNIHTGRVTGKAKVPSTGNFIDFNSSPYKSNVKLSSSGKFFGYAWSVDGGWVNFAEIRSSGAAFASNIQDSTVSSSEQSTSSPEVVGEAVESSTPSTSSESVSTSTNPNQPSSSTPPLVLYTLIGMGASAIGLLAYRRFGIKPR